MAERTPPARAAGGQQTLPLVEYLARVGRRSADAGMSGCLRARHLIALKLLGEHGPMTQHAVGTALSLDPSNVVGLLNELEERGLVVRRRDPADRRRHIVELSPQGDKELGLANARLSGVEDDLLRALTIQERETLYEMLVRVVGVRADACDVAEESSPCMG